MGMVESSILTANFLPSLLSASVRHNKWPTVIESKLFCRESEVKVKFFFSTESSYIRAHKCRGGGRKKWRRERERAGHAVLCLYGSLLRAIPWI